MRILLIEPGQPAVEKEINGSLQSMQEIVGGTIQAIYPFEGPVALICNDEGKLLGLPPNRALYDETSGNVYDVIVGTFFICGAPVGAEDFTSLTDEAGKIQETVFPTRTILGECYENSKQPIGEV